MIEGRWEVIRLGLSHGITLHFIDRDTEGYHPEKQFLAPVGAAIPPLRGGSHPLELSKIIEKKVLCTLHYYAFEQSACQFISVDVLLINKPRFCNRMTIACLETLENPPDSHIAAAMKGHCSTKGSSR